MFRITRRPILAALAFIVSLALPTSASAQAGQAAAKVDLTGKWLFTVTTDAGAGTPTVTFRQSGDSLTGHYSSQAFGEVDFKGTVKDRTIKFSFPASVQGTNLTITYSGTIEGADALKGTVAFGEYGGGTFTAKKQ